MLRYMVMMMMMMTMMEETRQREATGGNGRQRPATDFGLGEPLTRLEEIYRTLTDKLFREKNI